MANINVIALGGLDEIHKNLYLIEVDAKLFIVDAGMYEPLTANFGIQHFVPKLDYIDQMRDRVKGIFLSQANKLELGAITEIMKIVPKAPIYGSKETVEFIKLLYKQADNWNLNPIEAGEKIDFSGVEVESKATTSSVPGTFGWIFHTEDGEIVYTVNSIYDTHKTFNEKVDLSNWGNNPLLLMVDSRNMHMETSVAPNYRIKKKAEKAFSSHKGRIISVIYTDELVNIVEMIELAQQYERPVSFINERIYKFVKFLMDEGKIINYPIHNGVQGKEDEVIIFSGTRTNLFKNFITVLMEDNKEILKVVEEDLVIMGSPAQAGNEHVYAKVSNELARHQCTVMEFSYTDKPIVHPSQFDLTNFLRNIKPKYLMPIKGYYKEMIKAIPIATDSGIPAENVIIADNGDKITIKNGKLLGDTDKVTIGESIIDDATEGDINSKVIDERETLASHGLVTVAFLLDKETKEFLSDIDVQMKGVVFVKTQDKLIDEIKTNIKDIIEELASDWKGNRAISLIKKSTEKTIRRHTTKSPSIVIDIHEN